MPVLHRQDDDVLIQTIAYPSTTLTTTVILGEATAAPTSAPPVNNDAGSDMYGDHNGLTNTEIGIMVGCIVGFTVLILGLIFCALGRRRKKTVRRVPTYYSASSGTASFVDVPSPVKKPASARVKKSATMESERIPGGPQYPTYRAIPIPNPRGSPRVRHNI